jgi:hypothetical protein
LRLNHLQRWAVDGCSGGTVMSALGPAGFAPATLSLEDRSSWKKSEGTVEDKGLAKNQN